MRHLVYGDEIIDQTFDEDIVLAYEVDITMVDDEKMGAEFKEEFHKSAMYASLGKSADYTFKHILLDVKSMYRSLSYDLWLIHPSRC